MIRGLRALLSLTVASLLLLVAPTGCGGAERTSTQAPGDPSPTSSDPNPRKGPLKEIKWEIVRQSRRSVQIGAFVPYCEYTKPEPRIERVVKRRRPGRVVLTMLVRFPPKKTGSDAGGCLGVQISAARWVKLDRNPLDLKLFDGSTSPPRRVQPRS
jgi:hypothetical protein